MVRPRQGIKVSGDRLRSEIAEFLRETGSSSRSLAKAAGMHHSRVQAICDKYSDDVKAETARDLRVAMRKLRRLVA